MINFSFRKKAELAPKIFLIEDSKTFLQTLKLKLKTVFKDGAIVRGYTESKTFLDELQENPAVVIMDYYLDAESEVEGVELLQQIRSKAPKSFILVLTGEEDIDVAKKCFKLGANSYMVKSMETLDEIVEEIHYKVNLSKF